MSLNYKPKVGEVVECDFGDFLDPPPTPPNNGLMRPEIRKRRMVVVLNGRLPNGCVLVVPISSSEHPDALHRGLHVPLEPNLFTVTSFYDRRDRWALAECITHVSKDRLHKIRAAGGAPVNSYLPREKVATIQRAVIKAMSAACLLPRQPIKVAEDLSPDEEAA